MRTSSYHIWLWEVPHILVWKDIYCWDWSQTLGDDQHEESHCSHSEVAEDVTQIAAVWLNLRVDDISLSEFFRSYLTKIAAETQKDPIHSTAHRLTLNSWPVRHTHIPRIVSNYWDFRDELSIDDDLLMKGEWDVILTSCRDSIIEDLHRSHEGINKAMSLARTFVYWPGMEADITDYIKRCLMCIDSRNLPVETHFKILTEIDSFQDPSNVYNITAEIDSFQDP